MIKNNKIMNEDICVCCGKILPAQGIMICWDCEHNSNSNDTEKENQKVEEKNNVAYLSKTT